MKKRVFPILISLMATPAMAELPAGHPSLSSAGEENPTTAVPLPNTGRVIDTFQSGGYTYIEVADGGPSQWLAAPLMNLEKGMHIRYSKGILMANFHSKSLNKTFDRILFVGSVEVINP